MERKVAAAIVEANANLQSATVGVGWGHVEEGHNRRKLTESGELIMFWANRERVPTEPVDYSLGVITIDNEQGDTIATLVNYACHPVVAGPESLEISADYVGVFTKLVEQEIGGECMFLQGAAGDINPFWDKTSPEEGAFEQMEKMGESIAEEVVATVGEINEYYDDPDIAFDTETVLLANRRDRERENPDIAAPISTLLIGDDIALAFFPGEFFVEHGLDLKEESKFDHTFFVGYTNDALAYFPTIKATTEGGYGAATATRVEVGAGERLVNRALINLYYLADMINP